MRFAGRVAGRKLDRGESGLAAKSLYSVIRLEQAFQPPRSRLRGSVAERRSLPRVAGDPLAGRRCFLEVASGKLPHFRKANQDWQLPEAELCSILYRLRYT